MNNRYNIEQRDHDEQSSDVMSVTPTIRSMDKMSLIQMKKKIFSQSLRVSPDEQIKKLLINSSQIITTRHPSKSCDLNESQMPEEIPREELDLIINQVFITQTYGIDPFDINDMARLSVADIQKRNCWSRWFGALTPGSMRGSIFALMQTALGAGILSLPYVFKQNGVLVGCFLLLLGGYLGYLTMVWLMEAANKTGKNNYAHIVEDILGRKAGIFLHIIFILLTFGAATLYLITTAQFTPKILKGFHMDDDMAESDLTRIVVIVSIVIVLLPLALQRNLSGLAHFSFLGILAIVYVVLLIISQSPFYIMENFDMDKVNWYTFDMSFFQGYAIAIFSFTAHVNIFMVKTELRKPIERRIKKIFRRAIFWEALLYLATALAGYFSLLDETPSLIIDRDPLHGTIQDDYLMLVGRIGVFILMLTSITIICAPCRTQIITFLGIKRKTKTWEHVFTTFVVYGGAAGIAVVFPDVIAAFSFIGGTGCVFIVFFFPMLIYVKNSKKKWYQGINLLITLLNFVLSSLGIAAATLSLLDSIGVVKINS